MTTQGADAGKEEDDFRRRETISKPFKTSGVLIILRQLRITTCILHKPVTLIPHPNPSCKSGTTHLWLLNPQMFQRPWPWLPTPTSSRDGCFEHTIAIACTLASFNSVLFNINKQNTLYQDLETA
ncbi:PREDICTED: uncharacterized protein LOC101304613 [Fragaria vesca subsp. vesca]